MKRFAGTLAAVTAGIGWMAVVMAAVHAASERWPTLAILLVVAGSLGCTIWFYHRTCRVWDGLTFGELCAGPFVGPFLLLGGVFFYGMYRLEQVWPGQKDKSDEYKRGRVILRCEIRP